MISFCRRDMKIQSAIISSKQRKKRQTGRFYAKTLGSLPAYQTGIKSSATKSDSTTYRCKRDIVNCCG